MFRSAVMAMALLVGAAAAAQAQVWTIDSAHTAAQFAVRHMMVSTVRGQLGKVTGIVEFDPAHPVAARVDVSIDVSGIDTREAARDNHLRSADFFDVAKFPTMTFKSTRVDAATGGGFKVTGDLTIKGVTRPVVLDVEPLRPPVKDQRGGSRTGTTATAKINRQDFGVSWSRVLDGGGVVVSDEVSIVIDVEMTSPPKSGAAL
jgi:polyisoprenoid-binding protein YceI